MPTFEGIAHYCIANGFFLGKLVPVISMLLPLFVIYLIAAVIVPEGKFATGKLAQALMHGARLARLGGLI